MSRRIWEAVLIEALQENKSTLSASGDGCAELLYTFTFSQYCGKLQVFVTVSIAMTSDVTRGEAYLISCCLFRSHCGESVFIAGTSVYHNPDILGKRVKNFRRTRH